MKVYTILRAIEAQEKFVGAHLMLLELSRFDLDVFLRKATNLIPMTYDQAAPFCCEMVSYFRKVLESVAAFIDPTD